MFSGFENLMALYGYSLQVYADFSGYTDIAIGIALILGLDCLKISILHTRLIIVVSSGKDGIFRFFMAEGLFIYSNGGKQRGINF